MTAASAQAPVRSASPSQLAPAVTSDRALTVPQTTADVKRVRELVKSSEALFRKVSAGHGGYIGEAKLQRVSKVGDKLLPQPRVDAVLAKAWAAVKYTGGGLVAGIFASVIASGPHVADMAFLGAGTAIGAAIPAASAALHAVAARQRAHAKHDYLPGAELEPLAAFAKTDKDRAVMAVMAERFRVEGDANQALSPSAVIMLNDIRDAGAKLPEVDQTRGAALVAIAKIIDGTGPVNEAIVGILELQIKRLPAAERGALARVVCEALENGRKGRLTYDGVHALAELPARYALAPSSTT